MYHIPFQSCNIKNMSQAQARVYEFSECPDQSVYLHSLIRAIPVCIWILSYIEAEDQMILCNWADV